MLVCQQPSGLHAGPVILRLDLTSGAVTCRTCLVLLSSALADLGLCFKMVDKHLFTMQCVLCLLVWHNAQPATDSASSN